MLRIKKTTWFFWQLHKPTAEYSFSINGFAVEFTDLSQGATSWLWDFGDGNTSTDSNTVHVYSAAGTYKVLLHAGNEIQSWDTISHMVTVPVVSGVMEPVNPSVRLYPVPASGYVTILSDHWLNPAGIEVFSLYGERMIIKTCESGNKIALDLSYWEKGIYFVRIHSYNGILYRTLVVD